MPEPSTSELARVLAAIDDPERIERLLRDLLTPKEYDAIGERWDIVKLLSEGMSQREIRDALKVSVTTVTRGNRQLQHGTGGFQVGLDVLKRLERRNGRS